jgi:hypothetical protein
LEKQRENKSSSPLGERIEVRGQFQGSTLTPAFSAKAGEGDVCHFYFEKINNSHPQIREAA